MTLQTEVKRLDKDQFVAGFRILLFLLSMLPAVYVFVAIQYSAITVPFWDHTELISWIASWYDGTFTISSLWSPHNHTRPLVYRAVMLFNALLTGWDIRSEYVYVYAAIYGVFAVHIQALRRLTDTKKATLVFPVSLLLVSLFVFSPAGHNNHWWSMMFQLNIANLLIVFGLLSVFLSPDRWSNHMFGVISCWLAAYSLTNGIFAFLTIIIVLQLASNSLRPDGWAVFWAVNLIILLVLYMPGMPSSTGSSHPSIVQLAWFSLVYLGAPVGSMLWFPFKSQFDLPMPTLFNGLCGVALVISAGWLVWHARERLRNQHPAALILIGFVLFSGISALATAWGRAAFDADGISNANASRYTIFGAYLVLGQMYYFSTGFAEGWWNTMSAKSFRWQWQRIARVFGLVVFIILSGITYVRAVRVYADAHKNNLMLASAYQWGLKPTDVDQFIHPNPDAVRKLKSELQRLKLGPYRNSPVNKEKSSTSEYRLPFPLYGNNILTQRFRPKDAGLNAIGVTMVTWENSQTSYQVGWKLYDLNSNERNLVAEGTFDTMTASDWQPMWLQFPYLPDSKGRIYEIEFSAQGKLDDQHIVGLPLYSMASAQAAMEPVVITSESISERLTLELQLGYAE